MAQLSEKQRAILKEGKHFGVVGTVGARNTGTTVRFWPDPKFFDSDKFSVAPLKHVLKAKAVLCPGLRITFTNETTGEKDEWFFTGDLGAYLMEEVTAEEDGAALSRKARDQLADLTSAGRVQPVSRLV